MVGSTAQQQPPTVTSVLTMLYGVVEQEVVSAAEAMPEDQYSFAPTNGEFKGVRTFAEQVKQMCIRDRAPPVKRNISVVLDSGYLNIRIFSATLLS